MTSTNASDETIETLCHHCGQAFSAFLHEMADQNAKVVCPKCRENPDCRPAKSAKPGTGSSPVKKKAN